MTRVFLSTVTADFGAEREGIRAALTTRRIEVKIQEDFKSEGEPTLELLNDYIKRGDAVVHLIGPSAGAKPAPSSVERLLAAEPEVSQTLRRHNLDQAALSYTQWEAWLAVAHSKKLMIFSKKPFWDDQLALAPGAPPPTEQNRHCRELIAQDRYATTFETTEELLRHVALALLGDAQALAPKLAGIEKIRSNADRLFGRDEDMQALIGGWESGTNIFALDAMGGAGKTALVHHFLQDMRDAGWRGAEGVFAWSFYSQGSNEDRQTSADEFFKEALEFFAPGEEIPEAGKRGGALARVLADRRALLVLDGIEPLQYAAGARRGAAGGRFDREGGLKDPDLKVLIPRLASANGGMAIITTRLRVAELSGEKEPAVIRSPLDRLPLMEGVALLRHLGVEPSVPEATHRLPAVDVLRRHLAQEVPPIALPEHYAPDMAGDRAEMSPAQAADLVLLVEELKGHALAVSLAGKWLTVFHKGDARWWTDLPPVSALHDENERDPFRVMKAIEIGLYRQIEEAGRADQPAAIAAGRQLGLLFFLGLFDRPAERELIGVVFGGADHPEPAESDLKLSAEPLPELTRAQERALTDKEREGREQIREAKRRVLLRHLFPAMGRVDAGKITEALEALRGKGLVNTEAAGDTIDCHPLVREYFGLRLGGAPGWEDDQDKPQPLDVDLFRAAHGHLYDHYRYATLGPNGERLPEEFRNPLAYALLADQCAYPEYGAKRTIDELLSGRMSETSAGNTPAALRDASPEDLKRMRALIDTPDWRMALKAFLPADEPGMVPLFGAIRHGCLAARETEAFREVYLPRISRGDDNFAGQKLGLYGPSIAALASFFTEPFASPSRRLSAADQAVVANYTGFQLRALGRLEDAVIPFQAGMAAPSSQENWQACAIGASNLAELLQVLGRLSGPDGALAAAEQAVDFADRSKNPFQRATKRITLAYAAFASGDLAVAETTFREAEILQKLRQPTLPRFYSLSNFWHADYLIDRGRVAEASARAAWALDVYRRNDHTVLLDIGLDRLTLARVGGGVAAHGDAVTALRKANQEAYIAPGLLALAEAAWREGDLKQANDTLAEAERIARRGPMPLFAADAALMRARMALQAGNRAAAQAKRDEAAQFIDRCGYGRRVPDLAVLDAELAQGSGAFDASISEAKRRILQGSWALIPRLEALGANCADLRAAEFAYNAEREAYLSSTCARDVKGYEPGVDPIALILAEAALKDTAFRGEIESLIDRDRFPSGLAGLTPEQQIQAAVEHIASLATEGAEEAALDVALGDEEFIAELKTALEQHSSHRFESLSVDQRRQAARELLQAKRDEQNSDGGADMPEVPDALLDQILADPKAVDAISSIMRDAGANEAAFADLPREHQRAVVAAFIAAQRQQQSDEADAAPSEAGGISISIDAEALGIPRDRIDKIWQSAEEESNGDGAAFIRILERKLKAFGARAHALDALMAQFPKRDEPAAKPRGGGFRWPFGGKPH